MKRALIFILMVNITLCKDESSGTFHDDLFAWSRTFAELLHTFETRYYQKPHIEDAMVKAMKGFVSFDPHSSFLDPKSFNELLQSTAGSFSGIGIVLDPTRSSGPFKIISVFSNKPADKGGVQAGDLIIAINDHSTLDMDYETLIEKLRGPKDSSVTITLLRNTQIITTTLTRDIIEDETMVSYLIGKEDPILYVSIKQFCISTADQLRSTLKKMHQQKINNLIIDLRDNGGGLLESAVDAASIFVPQKSLITLTKDQHNKNMAYYHTKQKPLTHNNLCIVILTNRTTASAAEIFAGALQYYTLKLHNMPLVIIIGEPTFGKGSVQEVIPLSNNCAVKLTIALYCLPDERIIQNNGLIPDLIVERLTPPSDDERLLKQLLSSEKHLAGALHQKASKNDKKKEESVDQRNVHSLRIKAIKHDNQILAAIDALRFAQQLTKNKKQPRADVMNLIKNNMMHNDQTIEVF